LTKVVKTSLCERGSFGKPALPLAAAAASLIQQETSKENIEYRIMNVERRRKSPFDILLFCGSLLWLDKVLHKVAGGDPLSGIPQLFHRPE
jgi:hypothetical protein